jgi:aminoglycoside 6'-N-acetyltransferase
MKERAFDVLIQKDEITIRQMQDNLHDYQLMAKWLTDEKVLEFYEGRDNPFPLERIIQEYTPRAMVNDLVVPCIFLYQDIPIGYLQYYFLTQDEKQNYGLGESGNICGIDLFIGETEYWNQGIGTKVISTLLNYLFELQVTKIVVDPEVWNTRAIRCYEKCGFQKLKLLPEHELHEGKYQDSWLMVVERQKSLN